MTEQVERSGRFSRPRRLGQLLLSTLRKDRRRFETQSHAVETPLRVASYNVHKCVGVDGRFNPERVAQVIAEISPDVIALQEADKRFGERAGLLDLDWLHRNCGLIPVALNWDNKAHGFHGNVVLYKEGTVTRALQLHLPGVEPRGAVLVDLLLPHGHVRVVAAHLGLLRRSRAQQAKVIHSVARRHDGAPTILMGDFNEWRLGPRSALLELSPLFGPLHSEVASFPGRFPVLSLDRILTSPPELLKRLEVHDSPLAKVASDHLPVKAELEIPSQDE